MAEGGGGRPRARPARCPRCDDLLPELANFTAHRCGSRNATAPAKEVPSALDSSPVSSHGTKPPYLNESDWSRNRKGITFRTGSRKHGEGSGLDLRKEEKLGFSPEASLGREFISRIDNKVDPTPRASGEHDGGDRYRPSSKPPNGSTSSEVDMLQGSREKRGTRSGRNRVPAFCRVTAEQMEGNQSPIYQEEGSSSLHYGLYRDNYSKKNVSRIGTEYLSRNPLQLLRQLDDLRDQISRSCEIAEGSREKLPGAERPVHSSRSCEAVDLPRERMPVTEVYDSPLHDNHGNEEQYGPKPLGKARYLPSSHYPESPRNDYLHRQINADPLTSYHHNEFNHQPSCPCMHCKHIPSPERVIPHSITKHCQRHSYFSQNHLPYHDALQILRKQEHNEKTARPEISENKDKHPCQAFAGAAPFVTCPICFELLMLSQIILLVSPKKLCKLQCGSCSEVFSIKLVGKRLLTSARLPSMSLSKAICSSDVKVNQDVQSEVQIIRKSDTASTRDFSGCKTMQSTDGSDFSPSTSTHGMMEKESMVNLREEFQMKGLSSSSYRSDNVESQESTIFQQTASTTIASPVDAASPNQNYLVGPLSNQVENFENASMNNSNKKMAISYRDNLQQSGDVDQAVTETDLSVNEYTSASLSQDYLETEKDQNKGRINKYKDSLVQKGSPQYYGLYNPSIRAIRAKRREVSINGHPIPDHLVRKAEKQAGHVLPGEYWYDSRAGFWGVMGQPCLGIILPFIEEFSYPMSRYCAGGNTGVMVNGRELQKKDLNLLISRGLPPTPGQHYVLEFSGKFYDEFTGEELGNIGKLAPTVEKMGRGFGMKLPM